MISSQKVILVVGSPRSGTSFLTDYLGRYVDHCYNEPWDEYPLGRHKEWSFPKDCDIVLKYCANSLYYKEMKKCFPNCKWIHVVRNPFHVIYSMTFPKDTWPQRSWSEWGDDPELRVRNAFYTWSHLCSAASFIEESFEVKYEDVDIESLGEFTGLDLDRSKFSFRNSNQFDGEKMEFLKGVLKGCGVYEFVESKTYKTSPLSHSVSSKYLM